MAGQPDRAVLDAFELELDRVGKLDLVVLLLALGLLVLLLAAVLGIAVVLVGVLYVLLLLLLELLEFGLGEVEAIPRYLRQKRDIDVLLGRPARILPFAVAVGEPVHGFSLERPPRPDILVAALAEVDQLTFAG